MLIGFCLVVLCFSLKPSSALPNKIHNSLPGSIWYRILGIGIVLLCFPGGGSFDSINTFEENEKSVM
jgi:hypothetical protein